MTLPSPRPLFRVGALALIPLVCGCGYPELPASSLREPHCVPLRPSKGTPAGPGRGAPSLAERIASQASSAERLPPRLPRPDPHLAHLEQKLRARAVVDAHRLGDTDGQFLVMDGVAWSPDGSLVASAHGSHVSVYDTERGRERMRFSDPLLQRARIQAVGFERGGQLIIAFASDGDDRLIVAWDVRSGEVVRATRATPQSAERVAWEQAVRALNRDRIKVGITPPYHLDTAWRATAPGRQLSLTVPLLEDGDFYPRRPDAWLTDERSGQRVRLGSVRNEQVRLLRFSLDGRRLVIAGDRRYTRAWDLTTGEPLRAFAPYTEHGFSPHVQAISPDGRWITQRAGEAVKVYAADTGYVHLFLRGHQAASEYSEAVDSVAFDRTGSMAATGDDVGVIRLWRLADGRMLRSIDASRGRLVALDFSPSGRHIVTSSRDEPAVRIRDLVSRRTVAELPTEVGDIYHLHWSDHGRRILAADFTESLAVWDLETCRRVDMRGLPSAEFTTDARLSHDGSVVAASFAFGHGFALWDAASGRLLRQVRAPERPGISGGSVESVSFAPGDRVLATGTASHTLLWSLPTLQPLGIIGQLAKNETAYVLDARGTEPGQWPRARGAFDAYGDRVDEALVCRVGHHVLPVFECDASHRQPGLLAELLAAP